MFYSGRYRAREPNERPSRVEELARRSARRAFRKTIALGMSALVAASACAEDRILPVSSVCGDGKKQEGEECDLTSDGCVECRVVKGFTCDETRCTPICGDGLKVGDEQCDPPDGITCDSSCGAKTKPEACDMTGYWITRQTTFSIDSVLSQVQTASNWHAYHLTQTGTSFAVDASAFCGIHVSGSATVDLTDGGVHGMIWLNSEGSDNPRGARKGTFTETAAGCEFAMDRFYFVRGLEDRFLPSDFAAKPDLSTLPALPYEDDPEHPTGTHAAGALDLDGDGFLGLAYRISGNASGTRNVVQRDWGEYSTSPDYPIPKSAIEFTAGAAFDNQENILHVSHCPLVGCGILLAGSVPASNLKHRMTFRYLGSDLSDPRVSAVFVADLRKNIDDDVTTCANVRAALPHDPSKD